MARDPVEDWKFWQLYRWWPVIGTLAHIYTEAEVTVAFRNILSVDPKEGEEWPGYRSLKSAQDGSVRKYKQAVKSGKGKDWIPDNRKNWKPEVSLNRLFTFGILTFFLSFFSNRIWSPGRQRRN